MPLQVDENTRVGGRVHWHVRVRQGDNPHLPRPTIPGVTQRPPRPADGNPKRGPSDEYRAPRVEEARAVAGRKSPSWI
jgi:hypothetical protein